MAIDFRKPSDSPSMLQMFIRYKAWTNAITFQALSELPESELVKPRQTNFGSMVHTMNHLYVVDDIFKHHLEGRKHGYSARNTDRSPPLRDLWQMSEEMDNWYIAQVDQLADHPDEGQLAEIIEFEFAGGGAGAMSRLEIFLHVVNHGTYHRGFVNDMMYQIPASPTTSDLPVFLRDVWHAA